MSLCGRLSERKREGRKELAYPLSVSSESLVLPFFLVTGKRRPIAGSERGRERDRRLEIKSPNSLDHVTRDYPVLKSFRNFPIRFPCSSASLSLSLSLSSQSRSLASTFSYLACISQSEELRERDRGTPSPLSSDMEGAAAAASVVVAFFGCEN